jgi:YD repeat-containing protein
MITEPSPDHTAEGVMATAYEYSPWYTVSCVIMPNGNKTRYSYDSYGRLEEVSDINGKKLQKYSYNYGTK